MALPAKILIPGGYGVFGSLLARELSAVHAVRLVIAGRDGRAAERLCKSLDPGRCEPLALDLSDPRAFTRAASGCFAVVCAAGPFQLLSRDLPRLAAEAGAHWLDIADDEGWVVPILDDGDLGARARESGVAVLPGLSTVPALSGALARRSLEHAPAAERVRIVLWIGNRNLRGAGAIASALASGFRDPVAVRLPGGECRAYRFRSPDWELLRRDPGIEAEFRVAFEWGVNGWAVARLQGLPAGFLEPLSRWIAALAAPFGWFGSDAGCLQAEALDARGERRASAALLSRGQRIAILPAAIALESLLSGERAPRGVLGPGAWMSPGDWIAGVEARGLEFVSDKTED